MNQTMDADRIFQSMHAIKELKTREDLMYHELLENNSMRPRLYLYQFIRDVWHIKRGTLDIGEFRLWKRLVDSTMRYYTSFYVIYQMKPGETRFNKQNYPNLCPPAEFFQDVRVFYLGDIGYNISESVTPEQVANKYFGSSDFSKIFSYISNRDYFNRRKSLEYAAKMGTPLHTELAVAKTVPLLGTHHHPEVKSTFQKYWDAWDEVASTDSDSQRQWDAASNGLHRGMSAAFGALSLVPKIYNKKKEIDSEQKQIQEIVEVPESERDELLTKGALSAQLMQRLSQDPSVDPIAGQRHKKKMFMALHNRVHSNKPGGGSNKSKSRTRKLKRRRKHA
jgi:hypothetical protein